MVQIGLRAIKELSSSFVQSMGTRVHSSRVYLEEQQRVQDGINNHKKKGSEKDGTY